LAYNLINTVTSPTIVSRSSVSMIDVMVTNKHFNENFTEVVNVGYSDHLTQVLYVSVNKHNHEPTKIIQRKFSKRNVEKFKDMLNNETWVEIYLTKNPNELFFYF
jgi:predicted fused transcriptional regulator/phosphomethylpyrimidine kinase